MKIAKLTMWDGRVFYTDRLDREHIGAAFDRARAQLGPDFVPTHTTQVDLLDMTPEEYQAIPATVESAGLFAQEGKQ